jgi:hypothetical protein
VTRNLNGLSFTQREDGTLITEKGDETWIEFSDGTVMHRLGPLLDIEKEHFASIQVNPNHRLDAKLGSLKLSAFTIDGQDVF